MTYSTSLYSTFDKILQELQSQRYEPARLIDQWDEPMRTSSQTTLTEFFK